MIPSIPTQELIHPSLYREVSISTALSDEKASLAALSESMLEVQSAHCAVQTFSDCSRWQVSNQSNSPQIAAHFKQGCQDFLLRVLRVGELTFKNSENYALTFKQEVDRQIREIDPALIGELRFDEEDWFFVKLYKWALCFFKQIYFSWMEPNLILTLTARHDILEWSRGKDLKKLYDAPKPFDEESCNSSDTDEGYLSCEDRVFFCELRLTEGDKAAVIDFIKQYEEGKEESLAHVHPLRLATFVFSRTDLRDGVKVIWDHFVALFEKEIEECDEVQSYLGEFALEVNVPRENIAPFFEEENWRGLLNSLWQRC